MHPAALVICTNHQSDTVLLVERKDTPVWVLPGGGIDIGESPKEAAARELEEETGVKASHLIETMHLTPINRASQHTHIFIETIEDAAEVQRNMHASSEECARIAFFPIKALPNRLFPLHKLWIEEALHLAQTGAPPAAKIRRMSEASYWNLLKIAVLHPYLSGRYIGALLIRCLQ